MQGIKNVSDLKSLQVSVSKVLGTVAAWTLSYANDMLKYTCDATDEVAQVIAPLEIPLNNDGLGVADAKIESIDVSYTVGTAALDANPVAEVQSVAKAVDGDAPVVATKACTVAAAGAITNTKTVDDHLIRITPNADLTLAGSSNLILEVSFDKAATSTVAITGITVNYRDIVG
jgi:hypothetical protein